MCRAGYYEIGTIITSCAAGDRTVQTNPHKSLLTQHRGRCQT